MSENVLETVRATVQDLIAPEMKTHGVRLENLDKRIDEVNKNLEHRIQDSKETLRAEMQALEARMGSRFLGIENLLQALESRTDARFLGDGESRAGT